MSWNVLEGLHRPWSGGPPEMDEARLASAQRLVAAIRPDVLVLNEALWCERFEGHLVDYAGLLGFPFSTCDLYDGRWGNAILTREPSSATRTFRIHNRSGVSVTLGCGLSVATYHPHPSRRPHKKAADFTAMLAGGNGPVALCGDFNAINPDDRPDRESLERGFVRFSRAPAQDVARFVDGGTAVFEALAAAGLRDAVPETGRAFTIPTDMLSLDKGSAMRLDHIMVSGDVMVRGGSVVCDPDAEAASDHRPVVADLLLAAA